MLYYLILIIVFILIVDQLRPRKFVKVHQQLGTDWKYLPIIGHWYYITGSNEDQYNAFKNLSTQYFKRKTEMISAWLGFKFFILIGDPAQAVAVLKSAFDQTFLYKFTYHLMGNGIVFAPAHIWHRRRKMLLPTFATRHVSRFVGIFEENAKIVVLQLESKVGKGDFSCWNYISSYGLDSVCETILGVKVGVLSHPELSFYQAFEHCAKIVARRLCNPLLQIDILYRLLPSYKRTMDAKKIIYDFVDNVIHKKKKEISENKVKKKINDEGQFKTFLELMLENSEESDNKYTYEELQEEVLALLLAGTDTSATGLAFTLLLLSQHQSIQDKVFKELEEVFGDAKPITFEDLHKLKYMDAVIKETLRLYPPIPLIPRDTDKEILLPCGIKMPSRCNYIINVISIHRNPKYWGSDAEYFRPERFLSETPQSPGAFIPFSYGTRNCPGNLYAMLSIKTTLVTILRRYRLLPATSFTYDKNNPMRLSFDVMLKHVDKFDVQIERRC